MEMVRLERVLAVMDVEAHPWKAAALDEWLNTFFIPVIHGACTTDSVKIGERVPGHAGRTSPVVVRARDMAPRLALPLRPPATLPGSGVCITTASRGLGVGLMVLLDPHHTVDGVEQSTTTPRRKSLCPST